MPIPLYNSETWKGSKEIEKRLSVFESNYSRKIMHKKWYEHLADEEVRARSGQKNVIQIIRTKRWRYSGHVLRMGDERLPKHALSWKHEGSRRPGRPKDTWRKTIQWDIRTKELEIEGVECIAQQKEDWRRFRADQWAT